MKLEAKPLIYSSPANPNAKRAEPAPVQVSFALESGVFTARFTVTSPSIFGKKELGAREFPFDFDAAEVFVTGFEGDKPKYFEFEVTPYNQGFTSERDRTATGILFPWRQEWVRTQRPPDGERLGR